MGRRACMDFSFNPDLGRFRRDFQRWLEAHRPDPAAWASLRDATGQEAERIAFLRNWQRDLAADRWLVIHWPEEYGGRGGSILEHLIVTEELQRTGAPPLINGPSLSIFGPTLLACGTDE